MSPLFTALLVLDIVLLLIVVGLLVYLIIQLLRKPQLNEEKEEDTEKGLKVELSPEDVEATQHVTLAPQGPGPEATQGSINMDETQRSRMPETTQGSERESNTSGSSRSESEYDPMANISDIVSLLLVDFVKPTF